MLVPIIAAALNSCSKIIFLFVSFMKLLGQKTAACHVGKKQQDFKGAHAVHLPQTFLFMLLV